MPIFGMAPLNSSLSSETKFPSSLMSFLCRLGSVASIGRGISTAGRVFSQNSLLGLPALMGMTNSPACMCCTQFIRSFSHPTKKYEKSVGCAVYGVMV